jgi:hypothetical protein
VYQDDVSAFLGVLEQLGEGLEILVQRAELVLEREINGRSALGLQMMRNQRECCNRPNCE